jgi:arginine decarboxylase
VPGTDAQGKIAKQAIPGTILSKFLDARRQEIARTGDYTVLILFSVGTTQGKSGTLLETAARRSSACTTATLRSRKPCRNSRARTRRYGTMTLRALLRRDAPGMTELDLQAMANQAGEVISEQVLTPSDAYQHLIHGRTDDVRIRDLPGAWRR